MGREKRILIYFYKMQNIFKKKLFSIFLNNCVKFVRTSCFKQIFVIDFSFTIPILINLNVNCFFKKEAFS